MKDIDISESMTVTQSLQYLGISRATFYRRIDKKLLPVYRTPGGVPMFLKEDLDKLKVLHKDGRKA